MLYHNGALKGKSGELVDDSASRGEDGGAQFFEFPFFKTGKFLPLERAHKNISDVIFGEDLFCFLKIR